MSDLSWSDMIQIRDAVHGYILIPRPIVKELIDLPEYQRLKDIQQTGMGVLYPSATHDRFTHSLGVYHLGCKAYLAFVENMRHVDSLKFPSKNYFDLMGEKTWKHWQLLFQLACLLHDCGHSPFSHTLEFVYDLREDNHAFSTEKLIQFFCENKKYASRLEEDLIKEEEGKKRAAGAPHERMSAYFITQEPFSQAICRLLNDWDERASFDACRFLDDLEFICRMITGCLYRYDEAENYTWNLNHSYARGLRIGSGKEERLVKWRLELQMRNCVIHMLNSALDVDNLDYTIRDAKISGYESQQIDIERLLSAFTVVNGLEFCEEKVAFEELDCPACIRSFSGHLNAYVFGACKMEANSENESIRVKGTLDLVGESFNGSEQEKERHCFFTEDGFYAKVWGDHFRLEPCGENACAHLFLRGEKKGMEDVLSGELDGIFYGVKPKDGNMGRERIEFAFQKSCLSVLQSAVEARNYEYLWIYTHHTTSYQNDFLLIYLLDRYAGYLLQKGIIPGFFEAMKAMKVFCDNLSSDRAIPALSEDKKQPMGNLALPFLLALSKKEDGKEYLQYLITPNAPGNKNMPTYMQSMRAFLLEVEKALTQEISEDAYEAVKTFLEAVCQGFQTCALSTDRYDPAHIPPIMGKRIKELTAAARKAVQKIPQKLVLTQEAARALEEIAQHGQHMRGRDMILIQNLLAFDQQQKIKDTYFFRSTDHDLLSRYKSVYRELEADSNERAQNGELYLALKEYFSRRYPACAWKTPAEYRYYFREWSKAEIDTLIDSLKTFSIPNVEGWKGSGDDNRSNICVLTDDLANHLVTQHSNTFCEEFWKVLKEYGIGRCVCVGKKVPTKALPLDTTLIRMKNATLRLRDIGLFQQTPNHDSMFYLYYERAEGQEQMGSQEVSGLVRKLRSIVAKKLMEDEVINGMEEKLNRTKELVIRDVVHGDIHLPALYAELVETQEFQRLRRIKQLATADQVFPGTGHSRFSHSLGTYFIMQKMVNHFKKQFEDLDLTVDEMDWKALLAAALLHDVGHGPFSHVFEKVQQTKSHEEWGEELIKAEESSIHRVLLNFCPDSKKDGEAFVGRVCQFIHAQYEHHNPKNVPFSDGAEGQLFNVFSFLVSSQLDADRMDYLLRDSYYSGFNFGNVDVDKLINGLLLTVDDNKKYYLCVREEYVPFVESYIIARFQMYRNIYFRSYKLFSESLLCAILKRAKKLCKLGPDQPLRRFTSEAMLNLFDQSMKFSNFILLDDSVVMGALQQWSICGVDPILERLCTVFLERGHFLKCSVLDGKNEDLEEYKEELIAILRDACHPNFDLSVEKLVEECGIIIVNEKYRLYAKRDWPIGVHCRNGEIKELPKVSSLLTKEAGKEEHVVEVYTDIPILQQIFALSNEETKVLAEKIKQFNNSYENRNHIEIEQKYLVNTAEDMEKLVRLTKDRVGEKVFETKYEMEFKYERNQEDRYFDGQTADGKSLWKDYGITIRIREYKSYGIGYKLTIKLPAQNSRVGMGQPSRFEYEYSCKSFDLEDDSRRQIQKVLERRIPKLKAERKDLWDSLAPAVSIKNKRNRFRVFDPEAKDGFCCEISFDDLIYRSLKNNDLPEQRDWQMEIELKSDFAYRVNLDQFSQKIAKFAKEQEIDLTEQASSKYSRALEKLGLLH